MSNAVLSNTDLVRHLLSQSTDATGVLSASKAIRQSQQPCTRYYERWAKQGCPQAPTDTVEQSCLTSLGGHRSAFCEGVFTMFHGSSEHEESTRAVLRRVLGLLNAKRTPDEQLVIVLTPGDATVRLQMSRDGNLVTLTNCGWRKRGTQCKPTNAQLRALLTTILTRTGTVVLPCPKGSKASGAIRVPRALQLRVARWVGDEEQVLMHGQRR